MEGIVDMRVTPNVMPRNGSPLVTVVRHRAVDCGGDYCCGLERAERVAAIKRGPRRIRNTALADALVSAGLR